MGLLLSEKQKELVNYYLEVTKKYPKSVVGIRVIKDSLTPSINGYYLFIKDGDNSRNLTKVNGRTVKALVDKKYLVKKEGLYLFNLKETSQKEKLEQKLALLKERFENRDYEGGFRGRIALSKEIKRLEYSLEGRDYDKEMAQEELERQKYIKDLELAEENSKKRAIKLKNKEEFTLPKGLINDVETRKHNRYNINAYRGEMSSYSDTGSNTGTARYGRGLYTTTSRSYAKQFGDVRNVSPDEIPYNPLQLRNQESFDFFEQKFCEEHGIMKKHLYLLGDISEVIVKMGYDGVSLHQANGKVFVKYI